MCVRMGVREVLVDWVGLSEKIFIQPAIYIVSGHLITAYFLILQKCFYPLATLVSGHSNLNVSRHLIPTVHINPLANKMILDIAVKLFLDIAIKLFLDI